MTREEFKKLYDLLELANPGEYEYDENDVISTHVYKGIWVSIYNYVYTEGEDHTEGKHSWSDCYDLRNANGRLWERHILDVQGKRLAIVDEVRSAAEKVFSPEIDKGNTVNE